MTLATAPVVSAKPSVIDPVPLTVRFVNVAIPATALIVAPLSVPTPEHYLPLLYILALQRTEDQVVFLTDGIELGSMSMLSVVVGALAQP